MAVDKEIQELQKQWQLHRFAAIHLNEPPSGYNRKRAEHLEAKISRLQGRQKDKEKPPWITPVVVGLISWIAFLAPAIKPGVINTFVDSILNPKGGIATTKQIEQPEKHGVNAEPATRRPDPAITMQGRFYGSKLGGPYARLDAGFSNYQRLTGTLARIQAAALKRRSSMDQLPTVWINRTREDCFDQNSIGVYNSQCQVIKLDYSDGYSTYEHPVEMEVTLAHEWGHHLINLSDVAMSPTEQEVVSDCFAGAVFGYYVINNLIDLQDAVRAIEMVDYIGNNSPYGHHPNRETRLRSFGGGLFSVSNPSDPRAKEFMASCASLHQIVDVNKIRQMGLSWES